MTDTKPQVFAGFWKRLFAWIIDCVLLSVVCGGAGWAAMDVVAGWGSNGRCVGLVAGILYFGILSSSIGGGKTLAMRMLGLKVVTTQGKPLNLLASLWRAIVLVGPVMLNGWMFPPVSLPGVDPSLVMGVIQTLILVAVFGVGLAQVILMLFGGPARRLVHDLVSGAVVVHAEIKTFDLPAARGATIAAGVAVAAVFGLCLAAPALMHTQMAQKLQAATAPQLKVQAAVNALPEVAATDVSENTTTYYSTSGNTTSHTLIVTARLRQWPPAPDFEMARIGKAAAKAYAFAPGQQLQVTIVYGFDMGFGTYNNSQFATYDPHCANAGPKCLK